MNKYEQLGKFSLKNKIKAKITDDKTTPTVKSNIIDILLFHISREDLIDILEYAEKGEK